MGRSPGMTSRSRPGPATGACRSARLRGSWDLGPDFPPLELDYTPLRALDERHVRDARLHDRLVHSPGLARRRGAPTRIAGAPAGHWVKVIAHSGYAHLFSPVEGKAASATHVGDEVLRHEHGYPLRLVAPGRKGWFWVKWVTALEVLGGPASPVRRQPNISGLTSTRFFSTLF
jgi:hypothetical protein